MDMSHCEWKPISSAPMDGEEVLTLCRIAGVWIVRSAAWCDGELRDDQGFSSREEASGWWSYCNSVGQDKLEGLYEPTHWAEMPEFD